jgi:hypothetical protein
MITHAEIQQKIQEKRPYDPDGIAVGHKPVLFELTPKRELHVRGFYGSTCIDCSQFNDDQVAEILEKLGYY